MLPLIAGKVVLRALELESPRIDIPVRQGRQAHPAGHGRRREAEGPGADGARGKAAPEAGKPAAAPAGLALAVDRIAIKDADVTAGPWKVEHANIDGHLSLDGTGAFKYSANLPGLRRCAAAKSS